MKTPFTFLLKIAVPIFCWVPIILANPVTSEILSTSGLIQALQSGGHIIYMRHGPTDHGGYEKDRRNLEDCTRQRNLSAEGRDELKRVARIIHTLGIPVGNVYSSPYCRTKDTAKIIFGYFQIDHDLVFSISKNKKESEQLGNRLYQMMINSEVGPNNVVFVGHTSNLKDGLGIWPKPEGVVTVFQKQEKGLVFKGMIALDEWPEP